MTITVGTADPSALVTAVVLTWNTADLAIQTMVSLTDGYESGLRLVLVDNGSVDDSVEVIERFLQGWEHSASISFVRSPENLGFTGGVNLGTTHALAAVPPPDYIWLLNPDAVVNPDTLWEMVAVARESGAGIVSIGGKERRVGTGARWPRTFWWPPIRAHTVPTEERWWRGDSYRGSCAIFDVELVRRLIARDGHFQDESLFMYWDERETTLRVRRLGEFVALSRNGDLTHAGGSPRGTSQIAAVRQYYLSRNSIAVAKRNLPRHQFCWMLPLHLARDLVWLARIRLRGEHPNEKAYLRGAIDGLRGKTGRWEHHPPSPGKPTPDELP